MEITIRKATENELPYVLLYEADPSREAVADYLERGDCYIALTGVDA